VREKCFAACVDLCKQAPIEVVARAMAETDERKRHRRRELEVPIRFHQRFEHLRQTQRLAQQRDHALAPVVAEDVPEFQGAETAA
jgi:hypothetical protein